MLPFDLSLVAAQYRCKYNIFEGLLSSYSEAARTRRQLMQPETKGSDGKQKKNAQYALEIFEEGRKKEDKSKRGNTGALGEEE